MNEPKPEQPPAPIVLSENCIVAGQFYQAGAPVPFESAADLPVSLKPLLATDAAPPPAPFSRNIYDLPHPALRRQARMLEHAAQEREWAIEEMNRPLPKEMAAAIEDAHAKSIALQKAQTEYNAKLVDAAYAAAQPPPPRQLFVKRGGEMGKVQRATLKPGELIFARTPAGEYEAVGHTNSNAEIPDEVNL